MTSSTREGVLSDLLAQVSEMRSRVAVLEFDVRNLRAQAKAAEQAPKAGKKGAKCAVVPNAAR